MIWSNFSFIGSILDLISYVIHVISGCVYENWANKSVGIDIRTVESEGKSVFLAIDHPTIANVQWNLWYFLNLLQFVWMQWISVISNVRFF